MSQATHGASTTVRGTLMLGLAVTFMLQVGASFGQRYQEPTAAEIKLLPPYCPHTIGFAMRTPGDSTEAARQYWRTKIGPGFATLHHYCWGLVALMYADRVRLKTLDRRGLLNASIREFSYVIKHSPPSFPLHPEIFTRRAVSFGQLGQVREAEKDFAHAIQLKPDYWPAYAYMSDMYRDHGEFERAREVLRQGMDKTGSADGLAIRLKALETSKASVKPNRQPTSPTPSAGAAAAGSGDKSAPSAAGSASKPPAAGGS